MRVCSHRSLTGIRLLMFFGILAAVRGLAADDGTQLARAYAAEVDKRLDLPDTEQRQYGAMIPQLLAPKLPDPKKTAPQYVVLVDRSEFVQAAMIYWLGPDRQAHFIGASPVSTGRPGTFDHSKTPTGVFEHTLANPDFRAAGTKNENGIRGYGIKGMRVYDFGWQQAIKGWRYKDEFDLRLQMHATDPILERRMGTPQSKGCVRIPASMNVFIDRHAILDADYDATLAQGQSLWVLPKDRAQTPWSGRYLIVVDSGRTERPAWSPLPGESPKKPTSLHETRIHAPDAPANRTAAQSNRPAATP